MQQERNSSLPRQFHASKVIIGRKMRTIDAFRTFEKAIYGSHSFAQVFFYKKQFQRYAGEANRSLVRSEFIQLGPTRKKSPLFQLKCLKRILPLNRAERDVLVWIVEVFRSNSA